MKRISPGLMAAAVGMSAAVALLLLFAASITRFAALSIVCLFFAALMTWIPLREEHGYLYALIEYAVVSGLSLAICRQSVYTFLFILLFGYYAIVRQLLKTRLGDPVLTVILRFFIFNVMTAAGLALLQFAFNIDAMEYLPKISVFAAISIIEGAFGVFMLLYKLFALLFDSAVRNILLPRR